MKNIILSVFVAVVGLAFSPVALAQTYYNPYQPYNYYAASTNRIPVFLSQPVTTGTVNEGYVYGVRAYDPDGNAITYSLTQAPSGMAINPVTHVIVWTPTQAGNFPVTISVFDYTNVWANQTFTVSVSPISSATPASTGSSNSSFFSAFGGSKANKALAIENIQVQSGPRNINNAPIGANCSVVVSWTTTEPSVGQVVYGTHPQPNPDTFQYEQAAVESTSAATAHSVSLPSCLSQQTYYFRVVAFTSAEHKVSAQQTILPLPIEVSGTESGKQPVFEAASEGTASVLGTIGRFLINPIVLVILIAALLWLIIIKIRGPVKPAHGQGDTEESTGEPAIAIPHH